MIFSIGAKSFIALGRFGEGNFSAIKAFAKKYSARILDRPFPKGVTLRQGLRAEIDAASEIHFRMKDVRPKTISYDIELKYIMSKLKLLAKTILHYDE